MTHIRLFVIISKSFTLTNFTRAKKALAAFSNLTPATSNSIVYVLYHFIALCGPGIFQVWDSHKQKLLLDLPGHADEVYAVDWSTDGQRVASGGKDKVLKM